MSGEIVGIVSSLAGVAGVPGNSDGVGSLASFGAPTGVAMKAAGSVAIIVSQETTGHALCIRFPRFFLPWIAG